MKRYDQNVFTVFVLLCGFALLLSCSTTRHTETVTTVETGDKTQVHLFDSTTTAEEIHRGEVRDTLQKVNTLPAASKSNATQPAPGALYLGHVGAHADGDRTRI